MKYMSFVLLIITSLSLSFGVGPPSRLEGILFFAE